jgi:hypothetical protein
MSQGVSSPPERILSVVIACDGAIDQLPERLDALARACEGLSADVFVVHSSDTHVPIPADLPIPTTRVTAPSELVPVLWGHGIAAARGRIVALTTTQFRVRDGWAHALLAEFDSRRLAAVGGRMALAANSGILERAVFLIRYSEHMGSADSEAPREIAGDNAAYVRDAVIGVSPVLEGGFWEVDVHRLMRAAGAKIGRAPTAVAEFAPALSLHAMLANRFVHGSHFGAYRVRVLRWPRWRALAVTPLVPAVLFARILSRMRRAGQPVWSAVILLPAIMLLLFAWAAGEAYGALSQASRANDA